MQSSKKESTYRSVEIFSGVGGLALGIANAGFKHELVLERDFHACESIKLNQQAGLHPVVNWPLFSGSVEKYSFTHLQGIDLLSGGPPCQPFSLAGKSLGKKDDRDMFPEAIRAVRELRPKAFLFENVKGLMRPRHLDYLEYIRLQLALPLIEIGKRESWQQHRARLENDFISGKWDDHTYRIVMHTVNAADYGVPQKRDRVFIVGIRSDIGAEWSFPLPTHSRDELLLSKFITGDYWEEHKVPRKKRQSLPASTRGRLERILNSELTKRPLRWRTVRDALSGLPKPSERASSVILNHQYIPGARQYPGHTGSVMDEPAKTLKAGTHGVPGGENMIAHVNGQVRYFTVREKARLQCFPDGFQFYGNQSSTTRQLGNAVPVNLATVLAKSIKAALISTERSARNG